MRIREKERKSPIFEDMFSFRKRFADGEEKEIGGSKQASWKSRKDLG